MSFWNWLWSKAKGSDEIARTHFAPAPPSPSSSPAAEASGPQMTSIRVSMPSLVRPVFSIQTAIELMRTLPIDENPDLVLRVLRKTLRSTGVEVEEVIKSALNQEDAILGGIATDRAAIELLEQQIGVRKTNITRLEGELEETREVRGRLEEAMRSETKVGPVIPPEVMLQIQAEARKKDAATSTAKPVAPPVPSVPKRSVPPRVPLPSSAPKPPKPLSATPPSKTAEESPAKAELAEIDEIGEPTERRDVPSITRGERSGDS